MKTYLTIWFNSEGSGPVIVAEKLLAMGFKPLKGRYDHVYNWGRKIELEEILKSVPECPGMQCEGNWNVSVIVKGIIGRQF